MTGTTGQAVTLSKMQALQLADLLEPDARGERDNTDEQLLMIGIETTNLQPQGPFGTIAITVRRANTDERQFLCNPNGDTFELGSTPRMV